MNTYMRWAALLLAAALLAVACANDDGDGYNMTCAELNERSSECNESWGEPDSMMDWQEACEEDPSDWEDCAMTECDPSDDCDDFLDCVDEC